VLNTLGKIPNFVSLFGKIPNYRTSLNFIKKFLKVQLWSGICDF